MSRTTIPVVHSLDKTPGKFLPAHCAVDDYREPVTGFAEWITEQTDAFDSQLEAAYVMCTTEKTLRTWRRGTAVPEPIRAPAIAAALGLPVEDVLDRVLAEHRRRVLDQVSALDEAEAAARHGEASADAADDAAAATRSRRGGRRSGRNA
jgi:hypothetical protein